MWKVALLAFLILAAGFAIYVVEKNLTCASGFESLARGMTAMQVIDAMGQPDSKRNGCRDRPTWVGEPLTDTVCATEYQYNARVLSDLTQTIMLSLNTTTCHPRPGVVCAGARIRSVAGSSANRQDAEEMGSEINYTRR